MEGRRRSSRDCATLGSTAVRHHVTSRLPLEDTAAGTTRCASRGCRQVFGLMGRKAGAFSYSAASQGLCLSAVGGVVPNYRCGAVPD